MLCKEFTDEEISDTLFQIEPMKALGPDGYPARFFFMKTQKALYFDVFIEKEGFCTSPRKGEHPAIQLDLKRLA
jgi:hypothetical protein